MTRPDMTTLPATALTLQFIDMPHREVTAATAAVFGWGGYRVMQDGRARFTVGLTNPAHATDAQRVQVLITMAPANDALWAVGDRDGWPHGEGTLTVSDTLAEAFAAIERAI